MNKTVFHMVGIALIVAGPDGGLLPALVLALILGQKSSP